MFQGTLHNQEHDNCWNADSPAIRIRLGTLWILIMECFRKVDNLDNVYDRPPCAEYDAWIEEYAFVAKHG
jgi:hypothetical protein